MANFLRIAFVKDFGPKIPMIIIRELADGGLELPGGTQNPTDATQIKAVGRILSEEFGTASELVASIEQTLQNAMAVHCVWEEGKEENWSKTFILPWKDEYKGVQLHGQLDPTRTPAKWIPLKVAAKGEYYTKIPQYMINELSGVLSLYSQTVK
jgi:hypothetical protein